MVGTIRHRCSRARRDRERGAVLVEAALIVPLGLLLVFGMIEFGLSFSDLLSMRSGTREGARIATVGDVANAASCQINGSTVTPPANPTTATDARNAIVCKIKSRVALGDTVRVKISFESASVGQPLTVCASYILNSITGIAAPFIDGKSITSSVTMRIERTPIFTSYTEPGGTC